MHKIHSEAKLFIVSILNEKLYLYALKAKQPEIQKKKTKILKLTKYLQIVYIRKKKKLLLLSVSAF